MIKEMKCPKFKNHLSKFTSAKVLYQLTETPVGLKFMITDFQLYIFFDLVEVSVISMICSSYDI
jgi:hypothetical protein